MLKPSRTVKQPPNLFDRTQKLVNSIEEIHGQPLIAYWNAWNGSICPNDVPGMFQLFNRIGDLDKAALFIKSDGGHIESALRLVHLIRRHVKHLTAFVSAECASAATIMALGADEIRMGPLGYLTPIDSSLIHEMSPIDAISNRRVSVSRDELIRVVKLWTDNSKEHHANPYSDLFQYVHPLVFGAIDRSNSLSVKVCDEVLSYHINDAEERARIATELNSEFPSHAYPITEVAARRLGLKVNDLDVETNNLLLELSECYSEMAQRAITDFDESNYHDNQILGITEGRNIQIYYQNDKDLNYIKDERRWQALNDESSWHKVELVNGKKTISRLHIS
ncbi:MAG: hypothetical protein AAGC70_19675 [Pseudomonadota bacterium]